MTFKTRAVVRTAALALLLLSPPLAAQTGPTEQHSLAETIPPARDIAYPGTVLLDVDATDIERRIFRVRQRFPVERAGRLTLLYPEWLPGKHLAAGEIRKVAGFTARAGGRVLTWRRDPRNVYAFHIDVPEGVDAVDVEFQFLSATAPNQGRIVVTPELASIQWIAQALYPAGYFIRNIPFQTTLKLPPGWKAATVLRPVRGEGTSTITYETVSFETLADSPAIAGAHVRRVSLREDVGLSIMADSAAELEASEEMIEAHRKLVREAARLFGAHHFDRYEFLLTISKNLGGIGLEHHRSSENGVDPGYFTNWAQALGDRNLLPHEYVHSWNGKFRRGADLWTPDFRAPMENSLLWAYEGQTQFWGYVLSARSGMIPKEHVLGALASIAAANAATAGHAWRPLIDTTNDPIIANRAPQAWRSWERREDYYNEGLLIWTDVDRIIRQQSRGRRSMDDFARAFFGMQDRDWGVLTYRFEDVVSTLNDVQPYDWEAYLRRRVDRIGEAPLEGLTEGGYRLVFKEEPTAWFKASETSGKRTDLSYSGGLVVGEDGRIAAVLWDTPAFNAGLTVGSEILAVNDRTFSPEALKAAIREAKTSRRPIRLLVKSGDLYRTTELAWYEGLRYPWLEKTGRGQGTLDALLAPRGD